MTNSPDQQDRMRAMLAKLWEQHHPDILGRYEVLAEAARRLRDGELDPEFRQQARSAAHKLAGALGTFGRQEGTERARKLEHWLQTDGPLTPLRAEFSSEIEALQKLIA